MSIELERIVADLERRSAGLPMALLCKVCQMRHAHVIVDEHGDEWVRPCRYCRTDSSYRGGPG